MEAIEQGPRRGLGDALRVELVEVALQVFNGLFSEGGDAALIPFPREGQVGRFCQCQVVNGECSDFLTRAPLS